MLGYSTSPRCSFRSGGSAQCGVCHRRGLSEGLIRRRRCRWTTRRLSLTHDRGDFVAALWLSSRCLHTSLLSSALPYLRVVDKTPPLAPRCALRLPFFTFTASFSFFSLRLGYCDFSFLLFNCRPIRVHACAFFLVFPGPNRHQSFPQKPSTPFICLIYIKIPLPNHLPTSHPDVQSRTTTTRILCRLVSSRLVSSPHCTFTG